MSIQQQSDFEESSLKKPMGERRDPDETIEGDDKKGGLEARLMIAGIGVIVVSAAIIAYFH